MQNQALPCKVRGCQGRFLAVRKRVKREYERSFDTLHMVVIRICIRLNADPDHTPFGVKHLSAWKEFFNTKFTFIKEENIIFFVCVSWLFRPLIKKISKCKWKKFISMFRTFLQIFDDFSLLAHPLCERIRNLITGSTFFSLTVTAVLRFLNFCCMYVHYFSSHSSPRFP